MAQRVTVRQLRAALGEQEKKGYGDTPVAVSADNDDVLYQLIDSANPAEADATRGADDNELMHPEEPDPDDPCTLVVLY